MYDEAGLPVALPDDQLPVTLPELTEFRAPEPDGEDLDAGEPVPPLARARDWATVELDLGDGPRSYRRELNVMPQWAGSCWYYLRYLDPRNDQALVDPVIERYWMVPAGAPPGEGGVDLYVGGAEHAVLHLLYSRFWHMVLYDLGHVSTAEPFRRLFNQGMIQADAFTDARGFYVPAAEVAAGADGGPCWQGEPVTRRIGKMGKSLKNGISPDEMYAAYGADTLRMYEMAIGPMEAERPWQTDDVVGVYRFLQRLWRNLIDEQTGALIVDDGELDAATARQLHDTVSSVRELFVRAAVQHRGRPAAGAEQPGPADRRGPRRAAQGAGRAAGADGRAAGAAHRRGAVGPAGPRRIGLLRALPRARRPGRGGADGHRSGPGGRQGPVPDRDAAGCR